MMTNTRLDELRATAKRHGLVLVLHPRIENAWVLETPDGKRYRGFQTFEDINFENLSKIA